MAPARPEGSRSERERICAAMVELVAEVGYQSTSVDSVISRAGVGRPAFDRHFGNLTACFAATWDGIDAEVSRRVEAAFDRGEVWEDGLRHALSAGLRYLADDEKRARLYVAEVNYVDDELLRDRQRDAAARLSGMVDLGRAGLPDTPGAPPNISDAVSGAIWHRVRQLVQTGRAAELPDQAPRFMYLAILPYRGAVAAQAELRRG